MQIDVCVRVWLAIIEVDVSGHKCVRDWHCWCDKIRMVRATGEQFVVATLVGFVVAFLGSSIFYE